MVVVDAIVVVLIKSFESSVCVSKDDVVIIESLKIARRGLKNSLKEIQNFVVLSFNQYTYE